MALTDHDIVISPNRGLAGNPTISFVGADALNSATITLAVTNATTVGTLTYAGTQAPILTLSDGSSAGSGLAKFYGLTDTVSTNTGALQVMGGVGIGKALYVAGNSTFTGNLTVLGTLNAAINTATNAANAYGVVVQDVSNSGSQYFPTMVVNNVGSQPLYDAAFNLSFYPNNAQLLVGSVNASSFGQITGLFAAQRGNNSGIQLANTGTLTAGGTITIGAGSASGSSMQFYTYTGQVGAESASERMRIHTNGYVGIGQSSPNTKLQVTGGALTTTTQNTYAVGVGNSSGYDLTFGTDAAYGYIQTWSSKPLQINNQGNNTLINGLNGGNVGIGTLSPSAKLHVQSGAPVSTPRGGGNTVFFFTGAGTTVGTNYLELQTPATSSSDILFSSSSTNPYGIVRYDHATNSLQLWTNSAESMRVTSTGTVLINATGISAGLSMSRGLLVNGDGAAGTTQLAVNRSGSGAFAMNVGVNTTGDVLMYDWAGGSYNINHNMAYGKLLVGSAGTPQAKFSVLTTTGLGNTPTVWSTGYATVGPNVTSQTGAALGLAYNTSSDQAEILGLAPGVAWKPLNLFSNGLIVSANSGVESARFNSTGLGINTSGAPSYKLDVYTSATAENVATVRNGTQTLSLGVNANAGAGSFLFEQSANALRFGTNNTERMRIGSSGGVGIGGNTNTVAPLTVYKAGTSTYPTADASSTAHLILAGTDSLVRLQMGTLNAAPYAGWIQASYDNGGGSNGVEPLLLNPGGGNVQIGITADQGYKLYVSGTARVSGSFYAPIMYDSDNTAYYVDPAGTTVLNTLTVGNFVGATTNYATSQAWAVSSNASQTGYFGGNFNLNGDGNLIAWGIDPFGSRGLLWQTRNNDAGSDADGGWDKSITGLTANKSYLSIVYIRRVGSSANGSFYHGCDGANTLNLNGTANGNPYFSSFNIGTLPQDVWCISIGLIQANNDANTSNTGVGGLYRMDTGQKISAYTDYKMAAGATAQSHRTYLYYSTAAADSLDWWGPGFYEINGNEPSIEDLIGSNNPGWRKNWFAPQYFDSANTGYYMQPSATSNMLAANLPRLFLNRNASSQSGISWYSPSYTAWATYMSNAGATGSGPTGNITAPNGTLVTSWALRNFIENAAGYGWTFESGTSGQTTPTVVAEIRASDGAFRASGQIATPASMSAPIYYDSDNSSYFFDGAGRTRMSTFDFGSASYYVGAGDWGMRNTTPYGWIQFGPANTGHAHIYTDRSNFYFNVNDLYTNGNWQISENYTQNGKYLGSDASIRAQIFYDQADTTYYMDLNSTTASGKLAGYMGLGGNAYSDYMSGTFGHSIYHANYPSIGWNNQYRTTGMSRYWMLYLNANSYLTFWNNLDSDFLRFYPGGFTQSTTSLRAPIFYDSDNTGYYSDPNGTSRLSTIYCGDVYNDLGGWFRNYNVTGIYNQTYANHFYADTSQYWNLGPTAGVASGIGLRLRDGFAGSIKMYMYADNSGSGLLDSSGSWKFRMEYGNANAELYNITYMNDCRPYIIYDRNDTTYYVDPNGTTFTKQHIVQNGFSFQANGYNNNGGYAMNNNSTYWGLMSNIGTNDWRLGYGGTVAYNGWNLRWDNGSTTWSNGSHRAPIFYDSDDTGYYIDPNSTSDAALRMRGGALFGPNVSWGAYLYVGSNGRPNSYASMVTTNGNLHLDCQNGSIMYLNYYSGNSIYNRIMYDIDNSGYYLKQNSTSRLNEVQSDRTYGFSDIRSPIFYDYNNTGYYWDGNSSTREYSVTMNILNFAGVGGDSGVSNQAYSIYQQGGAWTGPYPDLAIGYHTGIKIGAYYGYNGTRFYNNHDFGTQIGSFGDGDNNLRSYYDIIAYASDRRLKENIRPIQNAVTKVRTLLGMVFDWKDMVKDLGFEPNNKTEVGVFAQDVEAVLPEAVSIAPFDYDWSQPNQSKSGERYLTVKYEKLVPLLIEAIKEQQDQIDELRKLIEGNST